MNHNKCIYLTKKINKLHNESMYFCKKRNVFIVDKKVKCTKILDFDYTNKKPIYIKNCIDFKEV